MPDPSIYEALRIAQPLTPIRGYGTPKNHLCHFERMQRWAADFIVTGDAICAFNPIYGHGMTVSFPVRFCLKTELPTSTLPQHLFAAHQSAGPGPPDARITRHIAATQRLEQHLGMA